MNEIEIVLSLGACWGYGTTAGGITPAVGKVGTTKQEDAGGGSGVGGGRRRNFDTSIVLQLLVRINEI